MEKRLFTTFGPLAPDEVGLVLPHEHIFTELGPGPAAAYLDTDAAQAAAVMAPFLAEAKAAGVGCLVEATPEGVGRRPDVLCRASRAAGLPVVIATGVYRAQWVPERFHSMPLDAIADWMTDELTSRADTADVPAGFIKVGSTDEALTPAEEKILRAAARASLKTGSAVASHTARGAVARRQVELLAEEGVSPSRFVWVHASSEPDFSIHRELGGMGVFLEYDCVGSEGGDARVLELLPRLREEGLLGRALISMDHGQYNPLYPGGGEIRGYAHLPLVFVPRLAERGFSAEELRRVTHDNVFSAFGR